LTIPDGVRTTLQGYQFEHYDPTGGADRTAEIGTTIADNLNSLELNVDRKTGRANFRYTPTPEWDINLNYSIEKRDGTKPEGSVIGMSHAVIRPPSTVGIIEGMVELPAPVDYTTHNFGASVQYKADLGDGRNWITNLAYAGSIFDNANDSLTYDNPFRLDNSLSDFAINKALGLAVGEDGSNLGRHSLEPDNNAHRFTLNTAADLSELTRFTGTVSYNMMRQDEDLLPWTVNSDLYALHMLDLPATSANAAIDTLTVNAKLTTRAFHPDVTNTIRYRYYSLDNDTPHLFVPERIAFDSEFEDSSYLILAPGYVKQNANLDTVWRASDMTNLGLLLGWEQYDRDIGREADVTDEYSVKATADLTPHDRMSVRASALYAERRFNTYDYTGRVDDPATGGPQNHALIRKYSMSDRDRIKLNASVEVVPTEGLTITGLGGFRNDEYGDHLDFDPVPDDSEIGLLHDRSWHAGVEINYMASDRTGVFASYVHENFDRRIRNRGYDANPAGGAANFDWVDAQITEPVDTFMAGLNVALIPDALDLELGYTYAKGVEEWKDGSFAGFPDAFPDVTTAFTRFDASLKYNLPEDSTQGTGLTKAFVKVQYAYERNRVTNWANDVTPYAPGIGSTAIWLAGKDPNYTAQIIMLTLGLGW
jgi:MtrB/PioB family decaheme-associated outer membrane protein